MADRRLQVFHTVGKMLSFTRAASMLQMTQPAVTFQIRQLEEQYNIRLFDRSHNKISLTEAGKVVFEYAEKIFDVYLEMENVISKVTGNVAGGVKIGSTSSIGDYILPSFLASFKKQYNNVKVQLKSASTQAVISMVENSVVDVGVIEVPAAGRNLESIAVTTDEMALVVPKNHPLANTCEIKIADTLQYPWLVREEGSGARSVFEEYLSAQGLRWGDLNVAMELASPESIKGAIENELGIAVLPKKAISKEQKLNILKVIDLQPQLANKLYFIYKKQKFSARAIDELINFSQIYYAKPENCENAINNNPANLNLDANLAVNLDQEQSALIRLNPNL